MASEIKLEQLEPRCRVIFGLLPQPFRLTPSFTSQPCVFVREALVVCSKPRDLRTQAGSLFKRSKLVVPPPSCLRAQACVLLDQPKRRSRLGSGSAGQPTMRIDALLGKLRDAMRVEEDTDGHPRIVAQEAACRQ